MKRQLPQSFVSHPLSLRERVRVRAGFTLVEMLVVIAIIGIIAGLAVPAVMVALRKAKVSNIAIEINSGIAMGCENYKVQFGEYPPDFCGLQAGIYGGTVSTATQNLILQHLAKAFPRYQPGVPSGSTQTDPWLRLRDDVLGNSATNYEGWGIDINYLSPASALTFLLGGKPDWFLRTSNNTRIQPGDSEFNTTPAPHLRGFLGFSANPLNPFDNSASRMNGKPFYDFDLTRLVVNSTNGVSVFWPRSTTGSTTGCIIYFCADNGSYSLPGLTAASYPSKYLADPYYTVAADQQQHVVYPAVDYPHSLVNGTTQQYTWVNPQSFQIFSAGLDGQYTTPAGDAAFYPNATPISNAAPIGPYEYPTGGNYDPQGHTFHTITNFSNGTLDSVIP